ncbi:MAG: type II toxin-antitoxin system VapC family toxin [Okeania sp. SIO3C4]|nr:type II toxin-antitoxin system VapC family toxin [Okeania sp. SIO3C4]
MIYIIDTNVISSVRRPERAPDVAAWLQSKPENSLYLSVITLGEIERGIKLREKREPDFAHDLQVWLNYTVTMFSDRILPFSAEDALIWGQLSAELGHADADLMIAAQALSRDGIIVTRNVSDFAPTGVRLENPFA